MEHEEPQVVHTLAKFSQIVRLLDRTDDMMYLFLRARETESLHYTVLLHLQLVLRMFR